MNARKSDPKDSTLWARHREVGLPGASRVRLTERERVATTRSKSDPYVMDQTHESTTNALIRESMHRCVGRQPMNRIVVYRAEVDLQGRSPLWLLPATMVGHLMGDRLHRQLLTMHTAVWDRYGARPYSSLPGWD